MKRGEGCEVVWVHLCAELKQKLGAVARQLHCTPAEAAALAIRTQLEKPDMPSLSRKKSAATTETPASSPDNRASSQEFP